MASPLRKAVAAALLLLLTACQSPPAPQTLSVHDLDRGQGAIIYGIAETGAEPNYFGLTYGVQAYLIEYDPATGQRIGRAVYDISTGNGATMDPAVKAGRTAYRFLKLPPGDYAVGWARDTVLPEHALVNYLLVNGALTTTSVRYINGAQTEMGQNLAEDVKVIPLTPRFHVAAGEVVYVGDLHFDVGHRFELRWSLVENEPAARDFAASTGSPAARVIVRPATRADGTPIGTPDRVGAAHATASR